MLRFEICTMNWNASCHEPENGPTRPHSNLAASIVAIPGRLAVMAMVLLIQAYRLVVSPFIGPSCRFVPTCSEYSLDAFRRYGFLRGLWMSVRRIGRCHPYSPGGYDPVP